MFNNFTDEYHLFNMTFSTFVNVGIAVEPQKMHLSQ